MPSDRAPTAVPSLADAVRRHPLVVLGIVLAALAAGAAWLALRSPAYEASAEILLTPVAVDDRALLGIELVRETGGDPTRSVQTAASLLESPAAAAAAANAMGAGWTPSAVRDAVRVEPQGQTTIIAVTARADSGDEAVRLANAYAESTLRVRDRVVSAQVGRRLADVTERLYEAPRDSDLAADLADQRETLANVRDGDPSLSLSQRAVPPGEEAGTPAPLLLAVALALGLGTGSLTALALEALARRRRAVPAAAGDAVPPPGDDALVDALARAVQELGPYVSRDAFDDWRMRQDDAAAIPKGSVIARRLGGWTVARDRAARAPAASNGAAPGARREAPPGEATERT